MIVAQYIIGAILLLLTIVLVALILKQTGKDKGLSGTLSGGADTFFSRSGGSKQEKLLFKLTIVFTVLFAILLIAMVILTTIA